MRLSRSTLLLTITLILTPVGCGTERTTDGASDGSSGEVALVSSESQQTRRAVEEFYNSWEGGADAARAVAVLTAHGYNSDYSACMAAKGYEMPWQSAIGPGYVEPDALQATRWLREPNRRTFTASAMLSAHGTKVAKWHERDLSDAEHTAGLACLEDAEEIGDDEVNALAHPPGYHAVMSAWEERTVAAVAEVAGTPEAFDECLVDKVLPGPDGTVMDVITYMEESAPGPSEIPLLSGEPSAAWNRYVHEETQLLEARWDCAEPVYDAAMATIPEVVVSMEADFPSEIAALREHWGSVKRDAQELGWSPQDPYAGWSPKETN